jgi:trehalose 6-phosphate phosphatase
VTESSRRADEPLSRALELARPCLARSPAGLLTDVDGTLSPIVADPSRARLVDGAATALAALADRLAVVAIVTGRAPLDARAMTGLDALLIAGNHGAEWLDPGAAASRPSPDRARVRVLLEEALARVPVGDGVTVDDKGLSATIHYRNATDPAVARDAILAALGGEVPGLELRSGRMSVELRPRGIGDKGSAARTIVERHGLRGVVVMGDDVTDLDMFGAVAELRAGGRLAGAIIGVGAGDAEVPAQVAEAADVLLADPVEAVALLVALASG